MLSCYDNRIFCRDKTFEYYIVNLIREQILLQKLHCF